MIVTSVTSPVALPLLSLLSLHALSLVIDSVNSPQAVSVMCTDSVKLLSPAMPSLMLVVGKVYCNLFSS